MRSQLKKLIHRLGYRISRVPGNRFDSMEDSVRMLQLFGYTPRIIVDAGANMGEWTRMVHRIFPDAMYHLIEPQPGCQTSLRSLVQEIHGQLHATAVTEPARMEICMAGSGGGDTGAYVCSPTESGETIQVAATTLDELVTATPADRALVKLDLENHELIALRGAQALLRTTEVIITEVSFCHPTAPLFLDTANFLRGNGFQLYDFAALASPIAHRRLRSGDAIFVRASSPLLACRA